MTTSIKDLLSIVDKVDKAPQRPMAEDTTNDNSLLSEWQAFKEQAAATPTTPINPITARPNPATTQAIQKFSKTVPGMPPVAKVAQGMAVQQAAAETGKPMPTQVGRTLAQAQQAVGATVMGAAATPTGQPINTALANVQRQSQVQQARAAQAAQKAAQAQGMLAKENKIPFAGEVVGQKPGDQVRGNEKAKLSRTRHPFQGRLVGTSESKK